MLHGCWSGLRICVCFGSWLCERFYHGKEGLLQIVVRCLLAGYPGRVFESSVPGPVADGSCLAELLGYVILADAPLFGVWAILRCVENIPNVERSIGHGCP